MKLDLTPDSIRRDRVFAEALQQLIEDAVRLHTTPEGTPKRQALEHAEEADFEAVIAVIDAHRLRCLAEAL